MSLSVICVVTVVTALSLVQSEDDGNLWSNGGDFVIPQCNSTCRYIAWAFDANCRQRSLEVVPQECWEAKMLDLRDNKIARVVANVFESFRNLLYVDLEDNGITDVHTDAFVGNDRVRHIYLQSNRLETIRTGTFTGVPNLLQLYLNSNRITVVEEGAFSGLSRLETLFLSENEIEDLPIGLLGGLERLRYFHMTHNRLTTLRNNTFKDLENLRHLNFINNNIRIIEAGAFKGLMSLRVLRLAYNEISIIGFRAFIRLRNLIQLDLYSNQLETISNVTSGINNIEELFLSDNPLKCDCKLEPLRLWYTKHEITDSKANATCNSPENMKGKAIVNIEDAMVCPPTPESPPKETTKQYDPPPAKDALHVKRNSHQQFNNNAVQNSTIAVIVIACVVLFAVCFVGLICFVYNAYFREPFNHKSYYKQISKSDSKERTTDQKINVTENPQFQAAP